MLVVHGASCPSKMAKLMACRRISLVICYIAFKTRISFKKQMKRCVHLLEPRPEHIKGGVESEFMVWMDGISGGD